MKHNLAIKVENLGKRYRMGQYVGSGAQYKTLRESLTNAVTAPLRRLKYNSQSAIRDSHSSNPQSASPQSAIRNPKSSPFLWALRDVSFEVKRGEVLGIIGRNGAGKSTLLKILTRITEPTEGRAELNGRVGSLLEVGTGFHPELTGRENVYLSGAILGMSRKEIDRKFDEIVDFSGVETYIDTPVKRYSSGMRVRLGFAVAAHLEPEILLIDEVLAVGDIAFQKKCLGKMGNVAKEGRTVLFVSHNMGAIRNLCERAIWLNDSQIVKDASAQETVTDYEKSQTQDFDDNSCVSERNPKEIKNKTFYFSRVEILNTNGEHCSTFRYGEILVLNVDLGGNLTEGVFSAEFYIYNEPGQLVSVGASGPYHGKYFSKKVRKIRMEIGPLTITSGKYRVSLSLVAGTSVVERIDTWESAIAFTITECQPFETGWEIPASREGVCVLKQSFYEIG